MINCCSSSDCFKSNFFLGVIFSFCQVYIPTMLLHLLNLFRFLMQAGESTYVQLAEVGGLQLEQQRPDSFLMDWGRGESPV